MECVELTLLGCLREIKGCKMLGILDCNGLVGCAIQNKRKKKKKKGGNTQMLNQQNRNGPCCYGQQLEMPDNKDKQKCLRRNGKILIKSEEVPSNSIITLPGL